MKKAMCVRATGLSWAHYAGILLLSMATLLLELSLTRVLSVANWYHFGFLVVSTALLGFGSAGVAVSLWRKLREEMPLDQALMSLALLFSGATLASFWLMQRIPFRPFRLLLDRAQLGWMLLYYVVLAAPFFVSGLAISLLLTRGGREVNRLYAADLLGAGLGCAAVCGVMPTFGGSGSIAIVAMIGVLAAMGFNSFRRSKVTLLIGVAAAAMLGLGFIGEVALPVRVLPEKSEYPLLPAGKQPMYTEWNTFSRIDVYDAPAASGVGTPGRDFFSIIIDAGSAGTGMDDLSVGVRNYLAHTPEYRPPGLVYIGKQHPKVLIIGSGAGREVLEGLYYGASSITAVEINPIINDIVSKRMREQWGGLFEQPEVRLVTGEGRNFVRRSKQRYDAIISVNTMSDAALSSGALSLSETYLLTREAFEEYWKHLTPNGALLVVGYEIPKLAATAREMFDRLGLGSPASHIFAFRGIVAPFGRMRLSPGFILQKSPLSRETVDIMAQRVGVGNAAVSNGDELPEVYYSPYGEATNEIQKLVGELVRCSDVERVYASRTHYLRPATDDKPFFYQHSRWSNARLGFRSVLGGGALRGLVDVRPVAEVVLAILLTQAVFVAAVMILLPLLRFDRQGLRTSGRWGFLIYFAGLGSGFILVEVVLLQRLVLFLGQPIYTFSVVLGGLLIFAGLGSYLAGRIQSVSYRTFCWSLLGVVGGIVGTLFVIPGVLSIALGLALPLRLLVAVVLVGPLGVLLGVPFPTGLRIVGRACPLLVPWAWAVNGFFTVIGSVAAIMLGMAFGFDGVLLIAAMCYLAALFAMRAGLVRTIGSGEVDTVKPEGYPA